MKNYPKTSLPEARTASWPLVILRADWAHQGASYIPHDADWDCSHGGSPGLEYWGWLPLPSGVSESRAGRLAAVGGQDWSASLPRGLSVFPVPPGLSRRQCLDFLTEAQGFQKGHFQRGSRSNQISYRLVGKLVQGHSCYIWLVKKATHPFPNHRIKQKQKTDLPSLWESHKVSRLSLIYHRNLTPNLKYLNIFFFFFLGEGPGWVFILLW